MPSARRRVGIRARVVAAFLVLLAVAQVVSVVVLREVAARRLDERVERDLAVAADDLRVRLEAVEDTLGRPGGPTVADVFDQHLRARPARADQAYLTFVDGRPFAASAGAPVALQDLEAAGQWATLRASRSGRTDSAAGPVRWLAVPVTAGDRLLGVFVATAFVERQQEATDGTVVTVTVVTSLVLAAAALLAWGIAGRALRPLRDLAATASSVSTGEDLHARVAVTGTDEVGVLARSFNGMMDDLESAFDSQKRFLDGAAHELRSPITIVRGHVELMDDGTPQQAADVALVLDELDRMERIVADLRLLARSERPDFLDLSEVEVDALVAEVGRKAQAMADRAWVVRAGSGAVVRGDRQRLTQALVALVDNAVHVTEPGDTVELGARHAQGGAVELWVRDSGPGIAAADLPTLFDREGRTVPTRPGGTGLGLPIVAAIARAHDGRPEATSTPGQGTTVSLLLPAAGR